MAGGGLVSSASWVLITDEEHDSLQGSQGSPRVDAARIDAELFENYMKDGDGFHTQMTEDLLTEIDQPRSVHSSDSVARLCDSLNQVNSTLFQNSTSISPNDELQGPEKSASNSTAEMTSSALQSLSPALQSLSPASPVEEGITSPECKSQAEDARRQKALYKYMKKERAQRKKAWLLEKKVAVAAVVLGAAFLISKVQSH
mmetsp:Transcript_17736/g.29161  ORF Transcript_17736/g.29161 Transcript_17736/m.29161 type:complete len:201 (+) Transcript_17736:160-762(+)|eukprot:CAMPEP_0184671632 /NCGR_PEP_ID=MMETSP0308-20130426/85620_1 /TAXON_ID=38269 /ORGANISM="Gloeochaete witrockiana, Strain SAG 46.84" /LENGTH=200 /DNA_ID=CAMNT_0027118803 /DNA_START=150 /DNA_END=752 /DNA_ORIENTATION=-